MEGGHHCGSGDAAMKVRDALLALLARGEAHGYQLKSDYERLTGAGPINVGQIYTTLDRLARDGLVARDEAVDDRRVPYRVTATGRDMALAWLGETSDVALNGRSTVAGKVLLALEVPGIDVTAVIDGHRLALLDAIRARRREAEPDPTDVGRRLVLEADVAVAEAELRWLDLCEAELSDVERHRPEERKR